MLGEWLTIGITVLGIFSALFLQAYLSKRKRKIYGLILPGLFFIYSIIAAFTVEPMETVKQTIALGVSTFFVYNVPTAMLCMVYMSARHGFKRGRRW